VKPQNQNPKLRSLVCFFGFLISISRHGMAWPTLYMPCMEALKALGLLSFSLELGGGGWTCRGYSRIISIFLPSRKYRYETFELGSCKLIH